MYKSRRAIVVACATVAFPMIAQKAALGGGTILFDATKAESAGNADWVIDADAHDLSWSHGPAVQGGTGNESDPQRYPTPPAAGITAATPETYWNGSFSSFGVGVVKEGFGAESLPYNVPITYGSSTNAQDLSHYSAFVLSEPNILFTDAEKTAILTYVKNGGGLIVITDHNLSDRNNDGSDSVAVFNDLMQTNSVQANPFGLTDNKVNISPASRSIDTTAGDPLVKGPGGTLDHLTYHNGSSFTLTAAANSTVKAAAWADATETNSNVLSAYGKFGLGRFVVLGDTSPVDDGTGDPNDTSLYDGWENDGGSQLMLNAASYVSAGTSNTYRWTANDGNWSTASNWDQNAVPPVNSTVLIVHNDSTSRNISYDVASSPGSLSLSIDNQGTGVDTLTMLNGSTLLTSTLNVGIDGQGVFNQPSANHSNYTMNLGVDATGAGTYVLSGSSLLSVTTSLNVGIAGQGTFIQNGGNLSIPRFGYTVLGSAVGGAGTILLNGGTFTTASDISVGGAGAGNFIQTGGTFSFGTAGIPAYLLIGDGGGGQGTFAISGGQSVVNGTVDVGDGGSGTSVGSLLVSGGNLSIYGSLGILPLGAFQLNGGITTVTSLDLSNAGTFNFKSGTLVVTNLNAGDPTRFFAAGVTTGWLGGKLALTGNLLVDQSGNSPLGSTVAVTSNRWLSVPSMNIGSATVGTASISGGSLNIAGALTVTSAGTAGPFGSRFNISGGTVTVGGNESIGSQVNNSPGIATQIQSGGTLLIAGDLNLGATPGDAGTLLISSTATSTNSTAYTRVGGFLTLGGTSTASGGVGSVTLNGGKIAVIRGINIDTAGSLLSVQAGTLTSGGNVNITAGTLQQSGGSISIAGRTTIGTAAAPVVLNGGYFKTGALANNGTFNLSNMNVIVGTGTAAGANILTNTGTILLHNATIDFLDATTLPGKVISDPSTIQFENGVTLDATTSLQLGTGDRFIVNGGNFSDNSTPASNTVFGAILGFTGTGSQTFSATGTDLNWAALEVSNTTSLTVSGGTLTVHDLIVDGTSIPTLTNVAVAGAGTLTGAQSITTNTTNAGETFFNSTSGGFTFSNSAVYTNSGTFNDQNDQSFTGAGSIHNTGIFRKQASGGTTIVSVPFNNDGLIDVRGGTLSMQGGGSGAGSINVINGAAFETVGSFTAGDVANNGTLNIARLSTATFGTIAGTGTLSVPSFPTTLNVNQITQNAMTVDGGTINFLSPTASVVNNLTFSANSSNPVFTGTASDNVTVPSSGPSMTVTGVFNSTANFTLNKGFILNLAGTGDFGGNNIDGGTNAQINFLAGSVFTHNSTGSTNIVTPLTTIAGEVDVNAGSLNIYYGGTHSGTVTIAAAANAAIGGAFSASASVNDAGSFTIIPSAGADSDAALPGYTGHNFSGVLNVQTNATLGFKGIGLAPGIVYFTNQSNITMGPTTSLNVVAGGGVYFNNPQPLSIGTATFTGSATFRNPGLTIGTLNIAPDGPTNIQFQNTGTITAGVLNLGGGILRTGQEANLPTVLSVGTFNFTGGEESGKVVVNNYMNWTGGAIDADYGHVIVAPGGTLSISGNGGNILQSGVLEIGGQVYTSGNLIVGNADGSNSSITQTSGSLAVHGTFGVGNNGSITGGSSTAKGVVNLSGTAQDYADSVILGNPSGGSGALTLSQHAALTIGGGLTTNDATVNGGTLTVLDQNPPTGEDAELNRAIVGGYLHNGAFNVNGGVTTTPNLKLGITSGNVGTFSQTEGIVNVGTFGVGNDASMSSGSGVGHAIISGGSLTVGTLLVSSTAGGVGDVTISGPAEIAATTTQNLGTVTLNDGRVSLGTVDGAGTIAANGGELTATHIRQTMLAVTNSANTIIAATATPNATASTSNVGTISMDNTGSIDLNNNDLIVNNSAQYATVKGAITAGYDAGKWDTPGITSTSAANGSATFALGYASAAAIGSTSFDGQSVGNATLVKYTLKGDTKLRGTVTGQDYNTVIANFNTAQEWTGGDFNYDGQVTGSDYNNIIANYNGNTATTNVVGPQMNLNAVKAQSLAGPQTESALATLAQTSTPASSDIRLEVNTTTGDVQMLATTVATLSLYNIADASSKLVSKNAILISSTNANWSLIGKRSNTLSEGQSLGAYDPNDSSTFDTISLAAGQAIDLGNVFNVATGSRDLTFEFSEADPTTGNPVLGPDFVAAGIDYTPEPGTFALLAVGSLATLKRKRRRQRDAF